MACAFTCLLVDHPAFVSQLEGSIGALDALIVVDWAEWNKKINNREPMDLQVTPHANDSDEDIPEPPWDPKSYKETPERRKKADTTDEPQ